MSRSLTIVSSSSSFTRIIRTSTSRLDINEIRILIQQQDLYTLPCESVFYVEGKLTSKEKDQQKQPTIGSNCVEFMFEIRYKLNGAEIDRNTCRNVEIFNTLKSYASFSSDNIMIMHNAGLIPYNVKSLMTFDGYFNFCVLLSMLLGFCEDYKRVVINARYELILIRVRSNNNCIEGDPATKPTLEIFKIQ